MTYNIYGDSNEPSCDEILSGLTYPKFDPSILGQSQYTEQLFKITDELESQGYDRNFIFKVVVEANIRYQNHCGLDSDEQKD